MAYNPFDDVIENDPAYMSNGGGLQVDLLTDKGFQDFFKVGREYLKSQGKDPFGGNYSVADIEEIGRNIANAQAGQKNVMAQQPAQEAPTKVPVPQFISEGEQIRNKQEKLQKLQDLYGQSAFTQSMQPVYQQRQQEDFSDVQQTIGAGVAPIFEGIARSETADRGKAKKEKNEQIKQQLGFGNQLLSKSQMDEAKQYGYEPLTIGETFAAIPDFMYGNQAESFRKLADGEQLEDEDKYNIITSPLDALDFLGVGIASGAVFRLLKRLKDKYKVPNLQKILDNPAFAGDGDVEEARQIVMGAAPPQGLPIEQGGRGQTVMFDKPDVPGDISPGSGLLDDIDTTKGKGKFQIEKVARSIDKINEVVKKVQTGELKPNLGIDQYEGLTRDFFNKALSGKYSFDVGKYLDLPIDEIQQLLASKKSLRMRNFKKNFKDIEEYIGKADAESLTNPEMADLFDVDIDMIKKNFSSKPEYKFKFKQSKYATPSDNYSFERILKENQKELGIEKVSKGGNEKRAEYLLFDGLFRSTSNKDLGLPSTASRKEAAQKFIEYIKKEKPNWKTEYRAELNNLAYLDQQRAIANRTITSMFNDYKAKYPEQFANENLTEYKLQISHNFPLRGDPKFLQGADLDAARLSYSRTNNVHHAKIESQVLKIKNDVDKTGKITEKQLKKLEELDKKAKKLGTLYFTNIGGEIRFIGEKKAPGINTLVNALEKHFIEISKRKGAGRIIKGEYIPGDFSTKEIGVTGKYGDEFTPRPFNKGGPVRMAIGGDPLQNINQQQFSPDPAVDQDYFQEAVDSGNLQAVNLLNLFKVFKKPKAMATPSNVKQIEEARDPIPAPTGSQEIAPLPAGKQDFFFKSFFLDQLNSQNAPKASTPQGWREFLIKGRKVPEAEMIDTGILQYLEDTEKFFPNKKITKQDLESLYDMSPLGNLEVRVKDSRRTVELDDVPAGENTRDFLDYNADQGRARHKGAGNAKIDEAADEYFEVVVNVPQLPGQEKAFVNSGHFQEPNVLGFTRVGTYKNADNQTVAVIQEMQTDMLTEVRKEQERLFAMVNALKRQRADLARQVEQARNISPGNAEYAMNKLRQFDQQYPESLLNDLATDNLIQPFPNIVAKELIPEKTRNLNAIQDDINKLSMANVEQYTDPAYKTKIFDLAQEQTKILDDLMSMNRNSNYQEKLKDFKVPSTSDREELKRIAEVDTYLPSGYNMKKLESFPPIPFNKQADYVDLLIKSTIKAAKQKGIDRVAIMPADIGANPRWGKSSDEAKKKFQNLYDKVGVQQLKNIAKKYDGTLNVEKIIDPSKTNRGLTFLNKNPDGEFQFLKQIETKKELSDVDRDKYYDEEMTRIASGVNEPGQIVLTREISPGQMMDYYLVEGRGDATDVGYRMIPLKEGESADDALIKIVEYNPSEIDMYTISFDPSKLEEPMYLFKKKSGGTIDKDSLVSITDIYGEYGR